jgi:hypothetical protein
MPEKGGDGFAGEKMSSGQHFVAPGSVGSGDLGNLVSGYREQGEGGQDPGTEPAG